MSHGSGLQKVIQSVNNHSTTTIPHTDGTPAAFVQILPFYSLYGERGGIRADGIWVVAAQAEVDMEGSRLSLLHATYSVFLNTGRWPKLRL